MTLRTLRAGLLSCLFWSVTFLSSGQTIANVKAFFAEGKVTILYDLTGGKAEQKYAIDLYSSHNNFTSPLKLVSGDVGKNITAGKAKSIEWNASGELSTFKGEISFRLKGEPVAIPFSFLAPALGGAMRRGKSSPIKWEGGSPSQDVRLELFKGTDRVTVLGETKNSGQYTWNIPKKLAKGSYSITLNTGQASVQSAPFLVKAKVPLFLKVAPFIVVGAVIAFWPDGPGPPAPPNEELPAAPGPK